MADLLTLNCPTCGGQLHVTNDVDRFVCAHCGNTHIVDPGVRVESLAGEVSALRAETDIRRLQQELGVLIEKRDQSRSVVEHYRRTVVALHQSAGVAAYFLALMFVVIGFGALLSQMPNRGVLALGAMFVIGLMVMAGRNTKRQPVILPGSLDAQIKDLARMNRQIAQKQRELDALQRRIGLASESDDLISRDTHHAQRTTTS